MKRVGFKPGVKERELWMSRVMDQNSEEEEEDTAIVRLVLNVNRNSYAACYLSVSPSYRNGRRQRAFRFAAILAILLVVGIET